MALTSYELSKDEAIMCKGIVDQKFARDFFARARSDAAENSRQNNYQGKNHVKVNNYQIANKIRAKTIMRK